MFRIGLLSLLVIFAFGGSPSFAQETEDSLKRYADLKKGFISVEVAGLTGQKTLLVNQAFNGFDVFENTLSTRLSWQYRIATGLSIGAGTGIDYYQINTVLPVYLAVTGNLSKKKLSPFYQFNIGHAFPWSTKEEEFEYSGGWYWETAIGLQSWISDTQAVFFKLGFQEQRVTIDYPFNWGVVGTSSQRHRLERFRAGLGFVF